MTAIISAETLEAIEGFRTAVEQASKQEFDSGRRLANVEAEALAEAEKLGWLVDARICVGFFRTLFSDASL